jgi:hypothetical protein
MSYTLDLIAFNIYFDHLQVCHIVLASMESVFQQLEFYPMLLYSTIS